MASTAKVTVVGDAKGEWIRTVSTRAAALSRFRRVRGKSAVTLTVDSAGKKSSTVSLTTRDADAESALAHCLEGAELTLASDKPKKASKPAPKAAAKPSPAAKPAPKAKPTPKADLSVLDQAVTKLGEDLATGKHDADLPALLKAETDGKTRKTAVEAIKERWKAITS